MRPRNIRDDRVITLLNATARDLLRYLERRLGADDAPDALSETMAIAWRREPKMPTADEDARLWMFGIARNVVLNMSRGRRRQALLAERLRTTAGDSSIVDSTLDVDLDVRAALSRLAPELGELITLVHWDGFSISEAAHIIGVPASTARSRYQKAKRQLGELLSGQLTNQPLGTS